MIDSQTEQKIKRCLKLCTSQDPEACNQCSYTTPEKGVATCSDLLMADALKLINQREQEIVDLTNAHTEQLMKILSKVGE